MRLYFGFGANAHPDMIRAITGKGALSVSASIHDFALCIESLRSMAPATQAVLRNHWDSTFVSYGIIRKPGASVHGRLWLLTNAQREAIRAWELVGVWSHNVKLQVRTSILGFPILVSGETEELRVDESLVTTVPGNHYKPFIVPKKRILSVATLVRAHA